MNINLATFAVRDSSGNVDLDGTMVKFQSELLKFQAERETETAVIAEAVTAVFDQHRGANIQMPAIVTLALQRLNVQPESYKVLSERVADFVRANAGTERAEGKTFRIAKGKGGGVTRWVDVPEKAEK